MLMIDRRAALITVKGNATDLCPWRLCFHIASVRRTSAACPRLPYVALTRSPPPGLTGASGARGASLARWIHPLLSARTGRQGSSSVPDVR